MACLAICLHLSSSRYNCSCLLRSSLQITTLGGSLLWSPYLQFACSVELCGSLLWSSIYQFSAQPFPPLPTPHRKWFMVGIGSSKFLHRSSFAVTVLVGGSLQSRFPPTGLPWNILAVPGILAGPLSTFDGISSHACLLAMSLNSNRRVRPKATKENKEILSIHYL